jgi:hypothetical protein
MRPITRFFIALSLLLTLAAPAAAVPSIVIDGSRLPADVPALVSGDHVLVPLRGVFEHLGARVSYDASSQTAAAALGATIVQVEVGSRTAWVNGERRTLDVEPREVAGRIMIPLRFVAESLGVSVDYDGPSDTVVIVTGFTPGNFAAMTSGPNLAIVPKEAPSVQDERPNSGSLIGSQYPSIYARFAGGSSAVDPGSVRISVDGADITGSSTISSAYVSYTPTSPLQTGQHSVSITGTADDGTPFSSSWTFRVDAGMSSDYTAGAYGSGLGFAGSGFDGFGFPRHGFGRFGFFPPGFSVFTPGQLFFVNGDIIEVIFVSQFFPFGNAFFTISGFPGVFPLTPWLGCPGFFWGFARVPFGVTAENAIIAARFTTPGGRKIVVRSTAPLRIEGQRRSLPSDIRYAILPRLINRPSSPRHAVAFERVIPRTIESIRPVNAGATPDMHDGVRFIHATPIVTHPAPVLLHPTPILTHPLPGVHPGPIMIHPAPIVIHPVIHPVPVMPRPLPMPVMPVQRFPMQQWQSVGAGRPQMPAIPNAPVKPK